jgi:AraC family transcriptional regulator, transcriptional activator of the genes for pyochelin and ferripyochelin receptors
MNQMQADTSVVANLERVRRRNSGPGQEFDSSTPTELANGFVLLATHRRLTADREDVFPADDTLKFHIKISGGSLLAFGKSDAISLEGPAVAMLHHADGGPKIERTLADKEMVSVTVIVPRDHFRRYLDEEHAAWPEALSVHSSYGLDAARLVMWRASASESALVKGILQCPYGGTLRQLYLESKATEVVYRVLSRSDAGRHYEKARVNLNHRERARLLQIRDQLDTDFARAPSLAVLGRSVGLNRNKLCFGFRQVFGTTIAEYCADRRMQRARELLLETQLSISEIALSVGYSSTGNFSTAFQKRFGEPPSCARRTIRG